MGQVRFDNLIATGVGAQYSTDRAQIGATLA